jgi:sugar phosphate isomerase/epimerase
MTPKLTRRQAAALPLAGLAWNAPLHAAAKTKKPLGFQLYTLRNVISPEKARASLKAVADIGYREIETLRVSHPLILPLAKEFGLKPISGHYETGLVTGNEKAWFPQGRPMTWEKSIEDAKAAGLKFMVIPYMRPDERSPEMFKKIAEDLNRAGEQVSKAGMRLIYHNHAFEFGPGPGGTRPIDVLLQTDAKYVGIELDVFWVAVAGEDPVDWMRKLKGRVPVLHLKDRAPGTPKQFAENLSPAAFREVGNGTLDFKAILKAAPQVGVEHYHVEQDQTAGDPIDALRSSYQHLAEIGF